MMNSSPSPQERGPTAATILLQRRRVRASLTEWARLVGHEPARHHLALIDKLEQVARGEIDRLIVCMPPGAAKSTYTSVLFPARFLAGRPDAAVIAASHTTELSERFGRRVRNLIAEHGKTLGLALRQDSHAAGRWQLESGGEYLASGVGQAILGFRADLIVVDDPIRSREDAYSEQVRKNTWEWFSADLKTRLKPGGRIVLISTRWHEDDLAGRLLAEMDRGGDLWETLTLAAIAEENDPLGRKPGEFLWDDDPAYPYGEFLRRELATQPPINWAALYQQRPAPEKGDYFDIGWLRPYDRAPPLSEMYVYAGSDYATTSKGGDWTVHVICGLDADNRLFLLDLWRGQSTPDIWIERMLDLAQIWKPMTWAEETGQIRSSLGPFIEKRCAERQVPLFRRQFTRKYDKAIMAQSIRGRLALSGLHVPTRASWYPAFQQELLSFPGAGKHDDQVDALALVGMLLDEMVPGYRPRKKPFEYDESRDPYREHDNMGSDAEIWSAMGLGSSSGPGRSSSDDVLTL